MTTIDIKRITTIERLRAMEELWDAICHEDQEVDSPAWHGDILGDRRKKIESGKAEFISVKDMKESIRR